MTLFALGTSSCRAFILSAILSLRSYNTKNQTKIQLTKCFCSNVHSGSTQNKQEHNEEKWVIHFFQPENTENEDDLVGLVKQS